MFAISRRLNGPSGFPRCDGVGFGRTAVESMGALHGIRILECGELVAAPNTVAPAETGPDANDLARAAIERLHRASTASEPARAPESPRVIAAPAPAPSPAPPAAPQLQPLPPPIMVSTPPDGKPPYPPVSSAVLEGERPHTG